MKNSWKIASFFGIPVKVHWSFGLIILYTILTSLENKADYGNIAWQVGLVLALFLCVVLHEYGHALAARLYGIQTEDIILLPIGGIARLHKLPEKPSQEVFVAIAGPLVNVAIALAVLIFLFVRLDFNFLHALEAMLYTVSDKNDVIDPRFLFLNSFNVSSFIALIGAMNVALAIFNMIPAFPMDGGRVLRALFSSQFGRIKATNWASKIGQVLAIVFTGIGLWTGNWSFILIGVFIFFNARMEYQGVAYEEAVKNLTVGHVARKHFSSLYTYQDVDDAHQLMLSGAEKNFLVFDSFKHLEGILAHQHILHAKQHQPNIKLADIMVKKILPLQSNLSIHNGLHMMHTNQIFIAPVYDGDQLIGVIDEDAFNHYMELVGK